MILLSPTRAQFKHEGMILFVRQKRAFIPADNPGDVHKQLALYEVDNGEETVRMEAPADLVTFCRTFGKPTVSAHKVMAYTWAGLPAPAIAGPYIKKTMSNGPGNRPTYTVGGGGKPDMDITAATGQDAIDEYVRLNP